MDAGVVHAAGPGQHRPPEVLFTDCFQKPGQIAADRFGVQKQAQKIRFFPLDQLRPAADKATEERPLRQSFHGGAVGIQILGV